MFAVRFVSAAAASALAAGMIPMAMAQTSVDANANVQASIDAKIERRCSRLLGNLKDECERLARVHFETRGKGNAEARVEARSLHGKFISALRNNREKNVSVTTDNEMRIFWRDILAQISAVMKTQVNLAFETCRTKTGDERTACVADAKARMNAKITAAISALAQ